VEEPPSVKSRFKGIKVDRHVAFVVAMIVGVAFLYYADEVPPIAIALSRAGYPLTRHALQRILFLIPIGYAALQWESIGGAITIFVSALIMMPRALFISPTPLDALSEVAAITFAGGALTWLIDKLGRERLERERMALRLEAASIINAVARKAAESLDLEELLQKTLSEIVETTKVQLGAIYVVDDSTGRLLPRAHVGLSEEQMAKIEQLRHSVADWSKSVASKGTPLVIPDIRGNPDLSWLLQHPGDKGKVRSYINVPFRTRERVLGTMGLVTSPGHQLDEWDIQLLVALGHQIGPAIHNAKLLEQTQRNERELRAFFDIAADVTSILDVDHILRLACERALQLSKSQFVVISLLSEDGQWLLMRAVALEESGIKEPFLTRVPIGQGVSGKVALTGRAIVIEDYLRNQNISHELDARAEKRGIRSTVGVPIKMADKTLGVLMASRKEVQIYSEHEIELLSMLANQAGVALENTRLYEEVKYIATLQERDRIAQEMHDGLAQALGYLNLQCLRVADLLSSNRRDQARKELEELRRAVKEAYLDVRGGIFALRLAASKEKGFIPSILAYLREFEAQSGTDTELVIDGDSAGWLSPATELQLIRIIQEGLANVQKHAGADKAWISIERVGEEGKITIEDNGQGFDLDTLDGETARHFGLQFMRERAESVGGTLEIETKPGEGTKVIVKVPFAEEEKWWRPHP